MAEPPRALETCVALAVCSFLDCRSLGTVEATGLDRQCVAACWDALRTAAEEQLADVPRWKPDGGPTLAACPKEALRELRLRRRNLARVPAPWAACVRKLSDTAVEICPRPARAGSAGRRPPWWAPTGGLLGAHHGGTEDYVGPAVGTAEGAEAPGEQRLEPPALAGLPLAMGCVRGEPMHVSILLTAKEPGRVGEACLLGVELVGVEDGAGTFTPVYFSPVSGRVFIRFQDSHEGLVAQPMPALAPEDCIREVEAFVLVGASGSLSFGRRRCPNGGIEWSGEIGPAFLPSSTVECFPSLTFQIDKLDVPAQVFITSAGDSPPASVEQDASMHEFKAVWSVHEWQ